MMLKMFVQFGLVRCCRCIFFRWQIGGFADGAGFFI